MNQMNGKSEKADKIKENDRKEDSSRMREKIRIKVVMEKGKRLTIKKK